MSCSIGSVKIVADENIPYAREAFGEIGKVEMVAGRNMTGGVLKDADILCVRSVTRVNEELISGSSVKMVGTATIGMDHVDEEYLAGVGIAFTNAAGCNSNSVSEYVTAALLTLAERKGFELAGKTIGVIGVGNVGSKVVRKCQALGMKVLKNDPPLKDKTGSDEFIDLDELISASDFITLHTPLTVAGEYATRHLVDDGFIGKMKKSAYLFNSSRGGVVDGGVLKRAIEDGRIAGAVLDVWEGEPGIDCGLLDLVELGTPHIAGYSFDGKVNGTQIIYEAACKFLGVESTWDPKLVMPTPVFPLISVDVSGKSEQRIVHEVVKKLYDIEADDGRLRELSGEPEDGKSKFFDQLRKHYPVRREFQNTALEFTEPVSRGLKLIFSGLGFGLVGED